MALTLMLVPVNNDLVVAVDAVSVGRVHCV